MSDPFAKARDFMLRNARLLERALFHTRFSAASPALTAYGCIAVPQTVASA